MKPWLAMTVVLVALVLVTGAAAGCGAKPAAREPSAAPPAAAAAPGPQSNDILAREPVANHAEVKHILISWRDLGAPRGGSIDPRAEARSREDAEALIQELSARIAKGEPFEALMAEYSEDGGSARTGESFDVTPDAPLVLDFKRLSLRLEVGEIGVVLTDFGLHIIKRVA